MSILITGGAGFIGSHMVHALLDAGHRDIVVVDNLTTGFRDAVPEDVAFHLADVGDMAAMREVMAQHKTRAVLHFAGSIVVPESVRDPVKYYRNNTLNTFALIAAAVDAGVEAFIFSSTAAVYDASAATQVDEAGALGPISPYGASKLMSEGMLRDICAASGMRYGVLRYFNVAGADPAGRCGQRSPDATHLIKLASLAALGRRDRLMVFGSDFDTPDGTGVRDYIHVSDLAEAHRLLLGHLLGGGASVTLNCGYGHGYSVLEVAAAVGRAAGHRISVEFQERRPGDPGMLIADSTRLRDLLGWRPRHADLDRIVADAYRWELHMSQLTASVPSPAKVSARAAAARRAAG